MRTGKVEIQVTYLTIHGPRTFDVVVQAWQHKDSENVTALLPDGAERVLSSEQFKWLTPP